MAKVPTHHLSEHSSCSESFTEADTPAVPLTVAELATLKDLVQGVPAIASVGTHLAWPATGLPCLRPFRADKDVWTINFIDGTVTRAFVDDSLCAASNAQFEGLPLYARGSMHPWNF